MNNHPLDCFYELAKCFQNLGIYMQFDMDMENKTSDVSSYFSAPYTMQHDMIYSLRLRFLYDDFSIEQYGNPVDFVSKFLPKELIMCQVQQNISLPKDNYNHCELYMAFKIQEHYFIKLQEEISKNAQKLFDTQFNKEINALLEVGAEKYLKEKE